MQERNLCARRVSPRLTPDEGYLGYPFFYRIAIRRKKTIKKWATILRFHHYKKTTKGQFGFEIIILWKGMGADGASFNTNTLIISQEEL